MLVTQIWYTPYQTKIKILSYYILVVHNFSMGFFSEVFQRKFIKLGYLSITIVYLFNLLIVTLGLHLKLFHYFTIVIHYSETSDETKSR